MYLDFLVFPSETRQTIKQKLEKRNNLDVFWQNWIMRCFFINVVVVMRFECSSVPPTRSSSRKVWMKAVVAARGESCKYYTFCKMKLSLLLPPRCIVLWNSRAVHLKFCHRFSSYYNQKPSALYTTDFCFLLQFLSNWPSSLFVVVLRRPCLAVMQPSKSQTLIC